MLDVTGGEMRRMHERGWIKRMIELMSTESNVTAR